MTARRPSRRAVQPPAESGRPGSAAGRRRAPGRTRGPRRRQCPAHRLGTFGTALDHHGSLTEHRASSGTSDAAVGTATTTRSSTARTRSPPSTFQHRATTEFDEGLRKSGAQPFTGAGRRDDRDRVGHRLPSGNQDAAASTSSRMSRPWRRRCSRQAPARRRESAGPWPGIRFSPPDGPRSWSRRHGSRTTSADLVHVAGGQLSRLAL